jgi:Spy/CpxP family protein refolding chaperone
MKRAATITIALAVLATVRAPGQQPPGGAGAPPSANPRAIEDALGRLLFPPELVMQQQRAIGLKPEQRTSITRVIAEFQTKLLDLQWQMQDESQKLTKLLDRPTVDQAAALAQVDKLLAVEREVKRAHLTLLIEIKNSLTADQQVKLAQARAAAEGGSPRLNSP